MCMQGVSSPWGSGALDLPSAPGSPAMHSSRHPSALQTPPGTSRSPTAARGVHSQAAEDNMPSTSCLLSDYNPFQGSAGPVASGGPFGARLGVAPSSTGLGPSPKRGTGVAGYASKALASKNASVAAAQSRRRSSSNSDMSDSGKL